LAACTAIGGAMARYLLAICIVAGSCGCLQTQLRNSTVSLSTTTNDLIYGQVLDNLALAIDNPTALPYFNMPASGTVQIQQSLTATYTPQWAVATTANAFHVGQWLFNQQQLAIAPQQLDQEAWQTTPVADPDRLFLMHCAYRAVLADPSSECHQALQEYYSAREAWVELGIRQNAYAMQQANILDRMWQRVQQIDSTHQPSSDPNVELQYLRNMYSFFAPPSAPASTAPVRGATSGGGSSGGGGGLSGGGGGGAAKPPLPIHIPYYSFLQQGWFGVGGKRDVPGDACYVGHHCKTYVWVTEENFDALAKFTLVILDFYNIGNSAASIPSPPPQTLSR
jgi:uncharacterized membrane protein YgcG